MVLVAVQRERHGLEMVQDGRLADIVIILDKVADSRRASTTAVPQAPVLIAEGLALDVNQLLTKGHLYDSKPSDCVCVYMEDNNDIDTSSGDDPLESIIVAASYVPNGGGGDRMRSPCHSLAPLWEHQPVVFDVDDVTASCDVSVSMPVSYSCSHSPVVTPARRHGTSPQTTFSSNSASKGHNRANSCDAKPTGGITTAGTSFPTAAFARTNSFGRSDAIGSFSNLSIDASSINSDSHASILTNYGDHAIQPPDLISIGGGDRSIDSKRSSLDRRSCSDYGSLNEANGCVEPMCINHSTKQTRLTSLLPKSFLSLIRRDDNNTNGNVVSKSTSLGGLSSFSLNTTSTTSNSTSALILEHRPTNLPAKSIEEQEKHRELYEQMLDSARKKEQKEVKLQRKKIEERLKHEENLASVTNQWKSIIPNWNSLKSTKKVHDLWWQGLPSSIRGAVWRLAIGNDLNITNELYQICLNRALERMQNASDMSPSNEYPPANLTSNGPSTSTGHGSFVQHLPLNYLIPPVNKESTVESIHLDVSRTFPHLGIFQRGGPCYDHLLNLLGSYVCYRPDVGYVQGMSFIAAVLLLNLDVFDAFVCLSNLLNQPCQIAFFHLKENKMAQYFAAYDKYFNECLPKLHAHFECLKLESKMYLIEWVYTLYSKSLPLDVACRLWDLFLRDGEEFLFRSAIGILHLYESILLSLEFDQCVHFLTHLPDSINSNNLFKSIDKLKNSSLIVSMTGRDIGKKSFSYFLNLEVQKSDSLMPDCDNISVKSAPCLTMNQGSDSKTFTLLPNPSTKTHIKSLSYGGSRDSLDPKEPTNSQWNIAIENNDSLPVTFNTSSSCLNSES